MEGVTKGERKMTLMDFIYLDTNVKDLLCLVQRISYPEIPRKIRIMKEIYIISSGIDSKLTEIIEINVASDRFSLIEKALGF